LYEGESKFISENGSLDEIIIDGIKPQPKGMAQIKVTIKIDYNGIIRVTAQDLTQQDNVRALTIIQRSRFDDGDIAEMSKRQEHL